MSSLSPNTIIAHKNWKVGSLDSLFKEVTVFKVGSILQHTNGTSTDKILLFSELRGTGSASMHVGSVLQYKNGTRIGILFEKKWWLGFLLTFF